MENSTLVVGSGEKAVKLDNVPHPYRLTGDGICESTGSVNALSVTGSDDKACKAMVAEFAEWYSKNSQGISGWYKILWEIAKVAQGDRGKFARECTTDPNVAYQESHIQKCGMLEADPVLGQSQLGKAVKAVAKLDEVGKIKAIQELLGCDEETAQAVYSKRSETSN